MRKVRIRKSMSMDIDHMRMLHQEGMEQLELIRTALEAAEHASGSMRDTLDDMAVNHWNAYMDVVHMICRHDEAMDIIMKKYAIELREMNPDNNEQEFGTRRPLFMLLLLGLMRRHRRFEYLWGWGLRGNPMSDYFKESMTMEREHTAELIAMMQSMM